MSQTVLNKFALLSERLIRQHGLLEWRFEYDRAKRRAGCCKHRVKLITLSVNYVCSNAHREDLIKDTILHEIAHALAGPRKGHGAEWKAICVRIGCKPIRCYSADVVMPKGKYQADCPSCRTLYNIHRRPKYTTGYYCRPCGPNRGKLTYKPVQ